MPLGTRLFGRIRRPTEGRSWLSGITAAFLAANPAFGGPAFDPTQDPDLSDDINAALADIDLKHAIGTTAQRPGTPTIGYLYYNTSSSRFETWDGGQWSGVANLFDIPGGTQNAFQDVSTNASVTISNSRVYLRAGCNGAQLTLPHYYDIVASLGVDFIWESGATGTVTLLRQDSSQIDAVAANLTLNAHVNRRFRRNGSNWETTVIPNATGYTRTQSDTFAASYTPDPTFVEGHEVTLTANITVNNVAAPKAGQKLTLIFTQDATGSRTVTWGTAYKLKNGFAITSTASSITSATFVYTVAGNWVQL